MARLIGARAACEFELGNAATAGRIVVDAVAAIVTTAPARATIMLGAAAAYAWFAGDGETLRQSSALITDAARHHHRAPLGHVSQMVRGTELLLAGEHASGLRLLRTALPSTAGSSIMAATYAVFGALRTGADLEACALAEEFTRNCRDRGQIGALAHALQLKTQAQIFLGLHAEAAADGTEALRIAEATGQTRRSAHVQGVLSVLAAVEGDDARCESLAHRGITGGLAPGASWGGYALGLLALGHGDHRSAVRHLTELLNGPVGHTVLARFALPSLVEALVRLGEPAEAHAARFEDWARASGQPWALGVAHRCRALLDQDAEPHFAAALDHHERGSRPFDHARTLLLYGQWLRRARRRSEAAHQLRAATTLFHRLGATPWLDRANTELAAIGARRHNAVGTPSRLDVLTAQESQVVRLAATGASNREIAARLVLSPRTVGYHLHNAFRKLGVTSRTELPQHLSPSDHRPGIA
jgi:DNA-binding CsgD family transcriptional regulator